MQTSTKAKFYSIILSSLFLAMLAAAPARADGECAAIKDTDARLVCIEKKIDALRDAPPPAQPSLSGVKIVAGNRPGQCLTWVDNGKSPTTVGCGASDDTWNIQK